jgi:CHAT domain-containing protein
MQQGQARAAEREFTVALEMARSSGSAEQAVRSLNSLAAAYLQQGRLAEADPLLRQAESLSEKLPNSELHLTMALVLRGTTATAQGDLLEGEDLLRRSITIGSEKWGFEHKMVASTVVLLTTNLMLQGRQFEAERVAFLAIELNEKSFGPDTEMTAQALSALARVYQAQGRVDEAKPILERVLSSAGRRYSRNNPALAAPLLSLATMYVSEKRFAEAEPLLTRGLALQEASVGPNSPLLVGSLEQLAAVRIGLSQLDDAERLLQRASKIVDTAGGDGLLLSASVSNRLAHLWYVSERYDLSQAAARQAVLVREKLLGSDHLLTTESLARWAQARMRSGDMRSAYPLAERGRANLLKAMRLYGDISDEQLRGLLLLAQPYFAEYLALLTSPTAASETLPSGLSPSIHAFQVAEHARLGAADLAMVKYRARALASDPKGATAAGVLQTLAYRLRAMRTTLRDEQMKPGDNRPPQDIERLRDRVAKLDAEYDEALERLARENPRYLDVSVPNPITAQEAQHLLDADEALLVYFALENRLLLWCIRSTGSIIHRVIDIRRSRLTETIARVRSSLDQSTNLALGAGRLMPVDVRGAHELYELLIGPIRENLAGVTHLLVVPDAALVPLPFAALLTRDTGDAFALLADAYAKTRPLDPHDLRTYSALPWLARDFTLTVLPSATGLKTLRETTKTGRRDTEALIGFGDPELRGSGSRRGGSMVAATGAPIDAADLQGFDRLPGTRSELNAVAQALGADPATSLYLGSNATKVRLRDLNSTGRLSRTRVIAFATHGLIGGEISGLREPALLLTPPAQPSDEDDGLLRLGDVLSLNLQSAEWVILSACNTAAPDGSGEGLSGLTRAFLFAGTSALLVSHWSVDDRATQQLMTEIFRRYAADRSRARAEAVRLGMLALINGTQAEPYFAHPFAWAPFFLVGEGRR